MLNVKKFLPKLVASFTKIVIVIALILLVATISLFIGYVYSLQSNPTLYIQGFSERANSLIQVVWGKPYIYPTLTQEPSLLDRPEQIAPELVGITKWSDDKPITLQEQRGKKIVVLVFGRLLCSYCFNVYTYLNEWQRNYGTDYLQVIALQSPKYEEEKSWADIEKKLAERDVNFPVGLDLEKETAKLYDLEFLPTALVIDKNGHIRYKHVGEGGFAKIEKAIQELISLDWQK